MIRAAALLLTLIALATPASAQSPEAAAKDDTAQSICLMIESAASANGIPLEFFVRVIWQNSRFRSDAVGPVTRSGERALGIAQFMPRTAAERGLLNPFDPVQALPKSAEFLRDLRGEFGNLGLAAAAYNAGPRRHARRDARLCRRDHRDDSRRMGRDARARPRTQARARLHHADGIAQSHSQSIRAGARAPNRTGCHQRLGRHAERRLLARQGAGGLRPGGGAVRDAAAGARPGNPGRPNRSRGSRTFYQVRAPAETRAAANALCAGIRKAGGACMVLRNRA